MLTGLPDAGAMPTLGNGSGSGSGRRGTGARALLRAGEGPLWGDLAPPAAGGVLRANGFPVGSLWGDPASWPGAALGATPAKGVLWVPCATSPALYSDSALRTRGGEGDLVRALLASLLSPSDRPAQRYTA